MLQQQPVVAGRKSVFKSTFSLCSKVSLNTAEANQRSQRAYLPFWESITVLAAKPNCTAQGQHKWWVRLAGSKGIYMQQSPAVSAGRTQGQVARSWQHCCASGYTPSPGFLDLHNGATVSCRYGNLSFFGGLLFFVLFLKRHWLKKGN